jgi:two-component system, OmpR family, sensor histidine kinase MprB
VTLRRRLALLSALAVAFAVLLASALVYTLVRDRLRGDIDSDLRREASRTADRFEAGISAGPGVAPAPPTGGRAAPGPPPGGALPLSQAVPPPEPGEPAALAQLISPSGAVVALPDSELRIPVSSSDRELAARGGEPRITDADASGTPLRVLTQPLPNGTALQVARSLEDTNQTLDTLVIILAVVSAGGIALAAALGPVVARAALAPAREVSAAAEEVARTHDLTHRIEVRGDDELGRLAASFNEMMAALERSEAAQRRLVADASHELRTPIATLRTNIEILGRSDRIDPAERRRLVEDLTQELEEMTGLVGDIVELARQPGEDALARQDVALDDLARDAIERAQRRARGLSFRPSISPSIVRADPERLGRAISNMLDNACKWSPPGGAIDVSVGGGRVTVRDHGPGFPAGDLDKVFDRFWRADEARGTPGSGLGLAIVQRVAEEHGGSAEAANAPGGGAAVSIELPESEVQAAS